MVYNAFDYGKEVLSLEKSWALTLSIILKYFPWIFLAVSLDRLQNVYADSISISKMHGCYKVPWRINNQPSILQSVTELEEITNVSPVVEENSSAYFR